MKICGAVAVGRATVSTGKQIRMQKVFSVDAMALQNLRGLPGARGFEFKMADAGVMRMGSDPARSR